MFGLELSAETEPITEPFVSFTQKVSLSRISQPLKVQTILLHLLCCDTFMSFR